MKKKKISCDNNNTLASVTVILCGENALLKSPNKLSTESPFACQTTIIVTKITNIFHTDTNR